MDRQEDELGLRARGSQLTGRIDAVQLWHGDVENNDLWVEPVRLGQQVLAVIDNSDNVKCWLKQMCHSLANEQMVVRDQYSRPFTRDLASNLHFGPKGRSLCRTGESAARQLGMEDSWVDLSALLVLVPVGWQGVSRARFGAVHLLRDQIVLDG